MKTPSRQKVAALYRACSANRIGRQTSHSPDFRPSSQEQISGREKARGSGCVYHILVSSVKKQTLPGAVKTNAVRSVDRRSLLFFSLRVRLNTVYK
jgi:hypothetical protein